MSSIIGNIFPKYCYHTKNIVFIGVGLEVYVHFSVTFHKLMKEIHETENSEWYFQAKVDDQIFSQNKDEGNLGDNLWSCFKDKTDTKKRWKVN